jgi:hypothetical protein
VETGELTCAVQYRAWLHIVKPNPDQRRVINKLFPAHHETNSEQK